MSENIFGCFVSGPAMRSDDDQKIKDMAEAQGQVFRAYIWGEEGLIQKLRTFKSKDYGSDLDLVLFKFYLKPLPRMSPPQLDLEAETPAR